MPHTPDDEAHRGAIFDLDGVLTDTEELHYQTWRVLADELGFSFSRSDNDALRGLAREESLRCFLSYYPGELPPDARESLLIRKNEMFLERVAQLTHGNLLPGIETLIDDLLADGWRLAVASSSRNARAVIGRLGLDAVFAGVVDGNTAEKSKPHPEVFELAVAMTELPSRVCVAIEDSEVGVNAAHAAGLRVVGVGPDERVGHADLRVDSTAQLSLSLLERTLAGG